ncbi:hypothetical protein BCR42DRAFT_403763 [Absidia repens]|uniref:F-box domain-containing protein n=1 Tax=Absidia repens TaxID=90262 RepID=A0A1X2IVG0_9FUNG|nr:hypothetical protein BCR42DRAFT_403763 [Absidia repens]
MPRLLTIEKPLLLKVLYYLNLQELLQLAETCPQLQDFIYNNPFVWNSHVLFPFNDSRITDTFIQQLVPKITRHYGIRKLKVIQLPLSWLGYLYIFDQFAHTVDHIQIKTKLTVLQDLVHHLTIFASNLIVLQQDNHIPITFRQYCVDAPFYYQVLSDHHFFGNQTVAQITKLFFTTATNSNSGNSSSSSSNRENDTNDNLGFSQLDDPPFERLVQWTVGCTDHLRLNQNGGDSIDSVVTQLEALVSFLAGRQVTAIIDQSTPATTTHSPSSSTTTMPSSSSNSFYIMTGQKRSQDQLESTNRQRQRLVSPSLHTSSLYV